MSQSITEKNPKIQKQNTMTREKQTGYWQNSFTKYNAYGTNYHMCVPADLCSVGGRSHKRTEQTALGNLVEKCEKFRETFYSVYH